MSEHVLMCSVWYTYYLLERSWGEDLGPLPNNKPFSRVLFC